MDEKSTPLPSSFADWSEKQLELLQLEQSESILRYSNKKQVVNKLQLSEVRIGSFGKTTLVLVRDKPIVANFFTNGSPVRVFSARWDGGDEREDLRGIVKSCEENKIEIILSKDVEIEPSYEHDVSLESLLDETTIQRITKALSHAKDSKWVQLLFGDFSPRFRTQVPEFLENPALNALNDSQKKAVSLACQAMDIAVIHGRKLRD